MIIENNVNIKFNGEILETFLLKKKWTKMLSITVTIQHCLRFWTKTKIRKERFIPQSIGNK